MDPDRAAFEAALAQTLESQTAWRRHDEVISSPDGLPSLLRHACRTVPHFQSLSIYTADNQVNLDSFPLTSREMVSTNRLAFLSSLAEATESPLFARTSGSTGRPLTVRFGIAEWYELTQASYRRIADAYPQLKELTQPGQLSVALIHDGANRQTTYTLLFELNYSLFSRMVLRGDPEADTETIRALRAAPVPLLYAKPAYLLKLAQLDAELGPESERIRPSLLLTSGENLYRDQRQKLEALYGCPVINAYTSVEGGLIGLQCQSGNTLHLDATRTLLEILTQSGEVLPEGEGEFVLTNLWNWTMPFIRYRTGDYGVLRTQTCACGHRGQTIVRLDAREVGSFRGAHGPVNSQELDTLFTGLEVKQFQFEQQSDGSFELSWLASEMDNEAQAREAELVTRLKQRLGDVRINVRRVESFAKRGFKTRRYFSQLLQRGTPTATPFAPGELSKPRPQQLVSALSPEAGLLAIAEKDCLVIKTLRNKAETLRIETSGASITCLQFSPTDDMIAFGRSDRRLEVWSLNGSGRQLAELEMMGSPACLTFSYDGLILVAGGAGGGVQAWSLNKDTGGVAASAHSDPITALATSSVSRFVAGSSRRGDTIEMRTLPDLELLFEIAATGVINSMAFMLDENILGAGYEDGRVELWNVDAQTKVTEFKHAEAVSAIAFCQPTQTLVAGNKRGEVGLWDVWRGRRKDSFQAHAAPVCGIAFLPDGRGYATLARDASVKQWPW